MLNIQQASDRLAVSLSLICTIHCLVLPLIATFIPVVMTLPFAQEQFHFWMVVFVIPVSIFALTLGCRKHSGYRVLTFGLLGLTFLISAVMLGEGRLSEKQEMLLTLLGASFIAIGHCWNYRLCKKSAACHCSANDNKSAV